MTASERKDGQLPSGRHGLPREAVERSQCQRLLDSVTRTVAEKGYEATTVADVVEGAGVSRTTFYELFEDKEECFFAAYDQAIDLLLARVASAFESTTSWPERVRAGLEAFLHELAAEPERAQMIMLQSTGAGPGMHRRYGSVIDRFNPFFEQGQSYVEAGPELPDRVAQMAVGAAEAVVLDEVVAGRAAELPRLLPDLLFSVLAPFLGPQQAHALMREAEGASA